MESLAPPQQLSEEAQQTTMLVSGQVYPELAQSVADSLGLQIAPVEFKRHANGELYARYEDSVRGKDVFIIQTHATHNGLTVEEAISQHRYLVRAARGSDARSIHVIAPYLGHSRGDRKARGREVVPVADVIEGFEAAGATRMVSVDLHSPQIQTIFRGGPYDHLTAQPQLRQEVRQNILPEHQDEYVVIAPDSGAKEVHVAATHPVLSGGAIERLHDSPIDKMYLSDTLPIEAAKEALADRLQVVRIGPMIGRAIYEILTPGGSISSLFQDQNHM